MYKPRKQEIKKDCPVCLHSFLTRLEVTKFCSRACCVRATKLRKNFNIEMDQYHLLLKQQNYTCAICKNKEDVYSRTQNLSVDHDHNTGKIRGLLCANCNRALGLLKDNIEVLKNAIIYMKTDQQNTSMMNGSYTPEKTK